MNKYRRCGICDEIFSIDEITEIDGENVCDECRAEHEDDLIDRYNEDDPKEDR